MVTDWCEKGRDAILPFWKRSLKTARYETARLNLRWIWITWTKKSNMVRVLVWINECLDVEVLYVSILEGGLGCKIFTFVLQNA